MTDTGQVPGEGQPESAGMVEQPGIPAPGTYTFLEAPQGFAMGDPTENAAEDDDLLLMPGAQGAWGSDPQAAPVASPAPMPAAMPQAAVPPQSPEQPQPVYEAYEAYEQPVAQEQPVAPEHEPAVQEPVAHEPVAHEPAVHEAGGHEMGTHETGGRDSGAVDLSAVRMPPPASAPAPAPAPAAQTPQPARRPLHMGPPVPDASTGVVRSLADRGPAGAPSAPMPVRHPGPPATGSEYIDVPREEPAPVVPAPQLGEIPPQGAEPWSPQLQPQPSPESQQPQTYAPASAETVVPEEPAARFVPVEGSVPTTPHLAPTPVAEPGPQPEPQAVVAVPAPREGEPQPVAEPAAEAPQPVEAAPQEPQAPVEAPEVAVVTEAPQAPAVAEPAPEPAPVVEPAPEPAPEPAAVAEPAPVEQPAAQATALVDVADLAVAVAEPAAAQPATVPDVAEPATAATEPAPAAAATEPAETEAEPAAETDTDTETEAEAETEAQAEVAAEAAPTEAEPAGEADTTVAPPAPGYDDAEREAVLRVMRERRDIRNGFRSDPIPHEVLLRVLEAAHTAPSVGHSQPWDFVVIRSAETRRTMHELATRQREAYAKSLPKGRAKQFKELKIEAILDTPVNIVVTADPTRGGRHTLGRHTQPQMAPYSSALAVENLWLAARAEGLGVGWVSFFDEREMVRALGLPEHLEVVAYLCVGYVDEFPEEPELMQAGWSKRRPLSWVVHEETYGRRALPGEEPHDLLQETVANIRPLDAKALGEAWERQKRMTKPAGALGMLEIISAQLSGLSRMCPPPIPEPAAVAIFAGDHGVHAQGVTAWPQEVTAQMVANFLGGGAVCNAFANQVGAEVCVVDVGVAGDLPATPGLLPRKVRPGTSDFTVGLALTREEALAAIEVGIETARDLVAAGNKALLTGEMGIANTTASAALISVYTDVDPAEVTGRGTGINDEMHARKVDVVRRALELHQPDPADPIGVLAAVGGLEHAALVGFILGGASLRTPVILDGVSAGAAALVARAIAPESLAACIAGHRSAEPGHVAALNKLGLRPLVDLDLRLGEGTGALLALPVVQSAARAMHEVATFDSAGVTEK
ncbi:nicotinate-nucleotide--dimethylbenzimidazole phosphoribosyltransferase [Streptomyces sp. NPDC006368]|uniref:nicotinate-nucleotide--dimethylbenzimidazole phosphoribosyltransferase n=1 Tax=Streptomyces sp. NPDC006368 TaxID=3156760 RepID=UPI0033ACF7A8